MKPIERAREIRNKLNGLIEQLSNEDALDNIVLFVPWSGNGHDYSLGERCEFGGDLYEVIQAHKSQDDWQPNITPALFKKISLDEYPEWVQPQGAHDAYKIGAKCSHNGKHWVNTYDNNIYEPGVFGWDEVSD